MSTESTHRTLTSGTPSCRSRAFSGTHQAIPFLSPSESTLTLTRRPVTVMSHARSGQFSNQERGTVARRRSSRPCSETFRAPALGSVGGLNPNVDIPGNCGLVNLPFSTSMNDIRLR